MKTLNVKELKSINGGNPVAWFAKTVVGGAVYDFSQGFVQGVRDAYREGK